jgi:branched-chain amino acid transport system substrate-binding protein
MLKFAMAVATALVVAWGGAALAQGTVKIGAIYPLSGNAASAGQSSKAAIEMAVDIVNQDLPDLGELTMAKGVGLPNMKGAKVEVVFADNQGTPAAGQSQALRLITEEKVAAIVGAYQSGITLTASAVAERYGIPFLTPESVATNLTERGFKWFFRVTPITSDLAAAYVDFLKERRAAGKRIDSIAIVNENTEYGSSIAETLRKAFAANGFNVTMEIPYSANSSDVQPQILQLKDKNPDLVIFVSYTSDSILYAKAMRSLNYRPTMMLADNAGFNDPAFVEQVGNLVEGVINRSAFAPGKPGTIPYKINEMFKARTGRDLDDPSARAMMGMLVMCDAINRAGGTEPAKIQAALKATDLKENQILTGYRGVKFDEKGQNILAFTLITQMHGGKYVPVWPTSQASAPVKDYVGWQ